MAGNYTRVPLHWQFKEISKAGNDKGSPSYESFRDNQIHEPQYKLMGEDRPSTHAMSIIRRFPNGTLDFKWAKMMVVDAVHKMAYEGALLPIDRALLTVIFPDKFREIEPMQAEILTQFSDTEKAKVRDMVEAHLKEEENWNAGTGGGTVEGRYKTRDGVP